jgi:hypothetical protein
MTPKEKPMPDFTPLCWACGQDLPDLDSCKKCPACGEDASLRVTSWDHSWSGPDAAHLSWLLRPYGCRVAYIRSNNDAIKLQVLPLEVVDGMTDDERWPGGCDDPRA